MRSLWILLAAAAAAPSPNLLDQKYWEGVGRSELEIALLNQMEVKTAKNVILFIGDGMGPATITAARIYRAGESSKLAFENFPYTGLLKTYSADKQVPDSASTATAMFSGVKVNYETVGVTMDVKWKVCEPSLLPRNRLSTIATWAQEVGKSTGVVTTTRVTHATPSSLYAHSAHRSWECDSRLPPDSPCKDIARQLVEDEPGKNLNVVLGGGRHAFGEVVRSPSDTGDPRWGCIRHDGRRLVQEWIKEKEKRGFAPFYVNSTSQLRDLNTQSTDFLLGLFNAEHMNFHHKRINSSDEPSLAEMVTTAIKVLKKNPNGFLLVVESGLIDLAHHQSHARMAMDEVIELHDAIDATLKLLEEGGMKDDTLIISTSDHAHTLTLTGYPPIGNNILGVASKSVVDGRPFTTLNYAIGNNKSYQYTVNSDGKVERRDPSQDDTTSYEYSQQAAILSDETKHGGVDVPVYATGPMSHLFSSVHEQNYIAHAIAYAANMGPYRTNKSHSVTVQPYCLLTTLCLLIKVIIPLSF